MPAGRWRADMKQHYFRPGDAVVWVWGKNSNDPGRRVPAVVAYIASANAGAVRYAIRFNERGQCARRTVSGNSLEHDAIGASREGLG